MQPHDIYLILSLDLACWWILTVYTPHPYPLPLCPDRRKRYSCSNLHQLDLNCIKNIWCCARAYRVSLPKLDAYNPMEESSRCWELTSKAVPVPSAKSLLPTYKGNSMNYYSKMAAPFTNSPPYEWILPVRWGVHELRQRLEVLNPHTRCHLAEAPGLVLHLSLSFLDTGLWFVFCTRFYKWSRQLWPQLHVRITCEGS